MRIAAVLIATLFTGAHMAESQDCKPPQPADAISAIRVLNQQYIDAARTSNATWFREHMADDVVVVLGNGRRVRKNEFLALLANEPIDYRSLTARDVTLRVFGATVQVDADAPWERGNGSKGVSRYIDTYAWLDCRWQVISAQITWLPQA